MCVPDTLVYTDDYGIYSKLKDWGCGHKSVCHGDGEYARDEDNDGFHEVHVNNSTTRGRGFDVIEDETGTPLCDQKFQPMLQKYLHYLLEPLYQEDYVFLASWSRKEASEVVDRIMAMDEQDQWALQRLKLIPGSMISGQGCNQKIVRPENPTVL